MAKGKKPVKAKGKRATKDYKKVDIFDGPVEIPPGVIDEDKYKQYLTLQMQWEKMSNTHYRSEFDPDLVINLKAAPGAIRRQTTHLPEKEREKIIELQQPFREMVGKMAGLKRQAYGIIKGKPGGIMGPFQERKAKILEMFGHFYSPEEVHRTVTVDWGFHSIRLEQVKYFQKQHIKEISELQKDYEENFQIRLGVKKSRLEELQSLYVKRKSKYVKDESLANENQLIKILEVIKKEIEGEQIDLRINGSLKLEVEDQLQNQIRNEMLKEFNITMLIISRIAAKMNVNPLLLLSRLQRSLYSKFAGFGEFEPGETKDTAKIPYYSNLTYDLDKLEALNKKITIGEKRIANLPVIEEAIVVENKTLKQKLLDDLKKKRESIQLGKQMHGND